MDRQSAVVRRTVDPHSSAGQVKTKNTAVASVSDKHFLAEDPDTHDEVIVLGQAGTHKIEELARDLLAVRHDYHELGQRASALASERDAVAARLAAARADAESARRQLEELRGQRDTGAAALETRLQSQQAELEAQRHRAEQLEARLAQSERRSEALRDQYEQERRTLEGERVAQLDALGARLAAAADEQVRLEAEREALAAQLEQAQQAADAERDAAREQIGALEQRLADSESRHGTALATARELEASLSTATEQQQRTAAQLATREQQRDALAAELEQAQVRYRAEQDAAGEQIDALQQRLAALEAEHATSLQRANELEATLSTATERQQSAAQRISELEQTLSDERGALQAELDSTREALARARAEQQQACDEQARLTDTLGRVEQQLAEAEHLNQTAREAAEARIAAAETAQRTLGEKVRELAEQLHAQHQQQDRLEQRARDQSAVDRQVRTELERKSEALQAELARLQEELERHRSAASAPPQQQTHEPAPPGDSPAGPNSWKMVAGASLLLGSMASATAYWNAARDGQNRVAADTAPARHAIARSPTDPPQSSPVAASPAFALSAAGPTRPPAPAAEKQSLAGMVAMGRVRHHNGTATGTALPDSATPTATTDGAATSAMLQSSARASLRALDDALTLDGLGLQGDASIRQQQDDLIALGFDLGEARADGVKGKYTRQALAEFQQYYLPADDLQEGVDAQQLAALVSVFAAITRSDQSAFSIDGEVLAAIRLSSLRTGLDFPYLMELAYTESSFDPAKKARRSSAAGLYQFTEATWLGSVKAYGAKYGLGLYASEIEYATDSNGHRRPRVANPVVHRHILALRYNPRIAALLAAEFALSNKQQLARRIGPDFGRTELYLTHFFGIERALEFLRLLEQHPDRVAAELFPNAAQSNPGVFEPIEGSRMTLREVYDFFAAKFDTGRYETLNPALALVQENWQ